jgi:hypothetical protein
MDVRIDVKKISQGNDNGSELESNEGASTKAPTNTPSNRSLKLSFYSAKEALTPMQRSIKSQFTRKLTRDYFITKGNSDI